MANPGGGDEGQARSNKRCRQCVPHELSERCAHRGPASRLAWQVLEKRGSAGNWHGDRIRRKEEGKRDVLRVHQLHLSDDDLPVRSSGRKEYGIPAAEGG